MTKAIQKKISAALSNKRKRGQTTNSIRDWQVVLNKSPFGIMMPSIDQLNLNLKSQELTEPSDIQTAFTSMIELLKKEIFNHEYNKQKLHNLFYELHQKIEASTSEEQSSTLFNHYYKKNQVLLSQAFINTQITAAIKLSKLMICVLSYRIKEKLQLRINSDDVDNIVTMINDLTELTPNFNENCKAWFQNNYLHYQDNPSLTTSDIQDTEVEIPIEDPQLITSGNIKDEEIPIKLANEIEITNTPFRSTLLEIYAQSAALDALKKAYITKHSIRKSYRALHNQIVKSVTFKNAIANPKLRHFCVDVINHFIAPIDSEEYFNYEMIQLICQNQFKEHECILMLCNEINKQRTAIANILDELQLMPASTEVKFISEFLNKKLKSPMFLKIEKRLNKILHSELYGTYRFFTTNVIQYIKILCTTSIYESAIFTQLLINNPSLIKAPTIKNIRNIKKYVKKLSKYSAIKSIKKECSYLLYALTSNEEIAIQLEKIRLLCNADLSEIKKYLLDPLNDEAYLALLKSANERTVSSETLQTILNTNSTSSLCFDLASYQEMLRKLGNLRLQAIQYPDNRDISKKIDETYNEISITYTKINVLIDLITVFAVLSENDTPKKLQPSLNEIQDHLANINDTFVYLSNIAHEFGHKKINPTEIFLLQIIKGDLFYKNDYDNLKNASIAMLFSVSPLELLDGIIEMFDKYSQEQKEQCLLFIENYLTYDTLDMLIPAFKPENSDFYQKLISFTEMATEIELSTEKLSTIIHEKINRKSQRFQEKLTTIDSDQLSRNELIQRINTISNKLELNSFHLTKLDEYIIEITHIIKAKGFSGFTSAEEIHLHDIFERLREQCNILPYYKNAFERFLRNINNIQFNRNPSEIKPSKVNFSKAEALNVNLLEIIMNTVENHSNIEFYNSMAHRFFNSIESEFANIFMKIDLCELRDLNWTLDDQRKSNNIEPNAPNVKEYHQYFELATQFIKFIIMYNVENNQGPKPHQNIKQIKKVYHFVEKAFVQALENNAITAALIIYKALQSKPIKRLGLSSAETETKYLSYLSKTPTAQVKIAEIFRQDDVLPLLSFIQQKLIFTYRKSYSSQFERLSSAGQALKLFILKKEHIANIQYPQERFFEQMTYFFQSLNLLISPRQVDSSKVQILLNQISNDIKPDTSKKFRLSDFESIHEMVKYLKLTKTRMINYQFVMNNPESAINDWMLSIVKSDSKFVFFTDYIESIFLLNDINHAQKRTYKNFHNDLVNALTFYHKRISRILHCKNEGAKRNLALFFTQYNRIKRLKDLKENDDDSFALFSLAHKEKDLLDKLDDLYLFYIKQQEQIEKQRSQTAYTQLLDDVLSGNATKSPLALPIENGKQNISNVETLLPENEFDIPSAEPEHPDRIGINRTMSFTSQEQESVLDLFNTDKLKAQFIAAFPWAMQIDSIKKLNQAQFNDKHNILGTPKLFTTSLQLAVMKFVLIAMDSLGKIAGFSGELTIQNFDRISDIINQLKWISAELQSLNVNETQLLEQVEALSYEMGVRNQEYFQMQQLYNPPFMVEENPNMNGFCHLNEHLAYQLTGANYENTLLAPTTPISPYLEQISQVLANVDKT